MISLIVFSVFKGNKNQLFARCGNKQLLTIGNYLHRLSTILEKAGKSY